MAKTKKFNFEELRFIPFDIGYMFYDMYTPSNIDNFTFWKRFSQELFDVKSDREDKKFSNLIKDVTSKKIDPDLSSFEYKENFKKEEDLKHETKSKVLKPHTFIWDEKILKDKPYLKDIPDCLCEVRLLDNLYCYILKSGLAVFVLGCFNNDALEESKNNNQTFAMRLHKWNLTNAILKTDVKNINDPNLYKDILAKEIKAMNDFKELCWSIANKVKFYKWTCKRASTGNPEFKHYGFSFSNSMFLCHNNITPQNIAYLQDSSVLINNPDSKEGAKKCIDEIKHYKKVPNKENEINTYDFDISFAWNGEIVNCKDKSANKIERISDLYKFNEIKFLIAVEINITAKYFIADNCVGNSIENQSPDIADWQTVQGMLESYASDLDNTTSSDLPSFYLLVQSKIITTSKIKDLYKSVCSKINSLKEKRKQIDKKLSIREESRGKRILLVVQILIALFAGAATGKTIVDVISAQYKGWYLAIFIFVLSAFVIVQAIISVVDYVKTKRDKKKEIY